MSMSMSKLTCALCEAFYAHGPSQNLFKVTHRKRQGQPWRKTEKALALDPLPGKDGRTSLRAEVPHGPFKAGLVLNSWKELKPVGSYWPPGSLTGHQLAGPWPVVLDSLDSSWKPLKSNWLSNWLR